MYTGVVLGTGRVTTSESAGTGHELRIETKGHVARQERVGRERTT
ncbi:hypothetical protein [Haloarchaeobius iranensis]|uniref:Uncharacterized protein n=1 Tax=Haloarchaeobius iranensis TaxID=996166 RepID=A0A1H0AY08_9EURY|nr:hypothetical protein [Haloarchaeobius iranensis]SDN38317.1 hypothetical protein SAMN05192554_13121 [Haloarchaeobius iranensis]